MKRSLKGNGVWDLEDREDYDGFSEHGAGGKGKWEERRGRNREVCSRD